MLLHIIIRLVRKMRRYRVALLVFGLVAAFCCSAVRADEEEAEDDKDSVGTVIGIDLGTTYSW